MKVTKQEVNKTQRKAAVQLVEVSNRNRLETLFLGLQPYSPAIWGTMTPQEMVEHLIRQVQYTNGKRVAFCEVTEEQARINKQAAIFSPMELPKNLILQKDPDKLNFPELTTAIHQLMTELHDFDQYFSKPGTIAIHGGFGPMNYEEWIIWHSKHFSHHLKQFGVLVNSSF